MRPVAFAASAIVILLGLSATSAANAADERKSASPDFVVYASVKDADFGSSLFSVLRGKGKVTRLEKADTIEKAVASEANVLLVHDWLLARVLPQLHVATDCRRNSATLKADSGQHFVWP